jgi:hypothetical protein
MKSKIRYVVIEEPKGGCTVNMMKNGVIMSRCWGQTNKSTLEAAKKFVKLNPEYFT